MCSSVDTHFYFLSCMILLTWLLYTLSSIWHHICLLLNCDATAKSTILTPGRACVCVCLFVLPFTFLVVIIDSRSSSKVSVQQQMTLFSFQVSVSSQIVSFLLDEVESCFLPWFAVPGVCPLHFCWLLLCRRSFCSIIVTYLTLVCSGVSLFGFFLQALEHLEHLLTRSPQ